MSQTSNWPLGYDGIRFVLPKFTEEALQNHGLAKALYPSAFGYYPEASHHAMQRDQHEDFLMIYCVKGKGTLELDRQSTTVGAGDCILLPAGKSHAYHADEQDPWSIYWCHFSGLDAAEYFNFAVSDETLQDASVGSVPISALDPAQHGHVLPLGIHPKLIGDFEQLLEVRQSGYKLRRFLHTANHLKQMLTYIGLLSQKARQQVSSTIDLDAVHAFMLENIHQNLELQNVAAIANLSKYHFSKKYKQLTGQSPIQHFIHLKMEHACYLLDISDKSIGSISSMLSYEDQHYFSRLFKKVIGVSPKEYRLLKRG